MRFIFIPGLGADSRIFAEYVNYFQNAVVLDWLPPLPSENLANYARRLAQSIDTPQPSIVVGLSFGGMLAPYIAEEIHAEYCVLLSSVKSGKEFPKYYRLGHLFFRYFPRTAYATIVLGKCGVCGGLAGTKWIRSLRQISASRGSQGGHASSAKSRGSENTKCIGYKGVCEQFLGSPTQRTFLFLKMMFDWAYETSADESVQHLSVIQIHGQKDWLIPSKNVHPDIVIPSAGHLFILTHFNTLCAILSEFEIGKDGGKPPKKSIDFETG